MAARDGAVISAVNHAEIVSKLLRCNLPSDDIEHFLSEAFPHVIPFDLKQAHLTGVIHAKTRPLKLSYADSACLALASLYGIPILTGDRKWSEFSDAVISVKVRLFR